MKHNRWLREYLPHGRQRVYTDHSWRVNPTRVSRTIVRFFEWILSRKYGLLIEGLLKRIQRTSMSKKSMHQSISQDRPVSAVVMNDTMLKFHEQDRRRQFQETWKTTCVKVGVSV